MTDSGVSESNPFDARETELVEHQPSPFDVRGSELDVQFAAFIDEHRRHLLGCLDDLSEEEARRHLVPSRTTLLSLLKHAVFVETVWFGEAVTGRNRTDYGLPQDSRDSFLLESTDTIASVSADYRAAVERSHAAVEGLDLDTVLTGHRSGPLRLRWVLLHVLRELAQHCGHADILREQILADRSRRG
ncbi:DinB family protein [Brevibacterium spongiae]|uniref:DinB family protein n=1 Tax=Brevibacterium spongiae TaxID=2909672 RepID=A0ABY5SQA0_9MICO|nr:DinB family protein [Brevibacterium spongiae]UVI36735.1 DinB family protein [Brevibacterium spongiae]